MNSVDKVIFDALVMRRSVVLPDAGSLQVKRRPAKKLTEDRIIPPQNVVVFTSDEIADGESIVSLIAAAEGCDASEAEAVYHSWLEGASSDDGITIENVGEISGGKFVVASKLHGELNPVEEIVMDTERNTGPLWAWMLGGLVLAVLVLGGFWGYKHGWFDCSKKDKVEAVVPVVQEELVVEEPVPVAAPEPPQTRYHIIAGAFAIESNADNFIKKLQREYPYLTVEKVYSPSTGYNMVSIVQTSGSRQAHNKLPVYWDIDLGIWVYKEN